MSELEHFDKIIRGRRSIRKFLPEPVEEDKIDAIIEAASWAPSSTNRQDWFFAVVTSSEIKNKMAEAVRERWNEIIKNNQNLGIIEEIKSYSSSFSNFADAPVVIVVSAAAVNNVQKHLLGDDAHSVTGSTTSAAMAAQNLMLAAHASGLGTCCMTGALAAREELSKILELGKRREIICLITLGKPAEIPSPPPRKSITEIRSYI